GKTANLRGLVAQAPSAWWQSLPTTWPGQAMAAAAHGHAGTAITYLAGSAALAIGFAVMAILLAARLFTTGWATYQEVGSRGRRSPSAGPTPAIALPTPRLSPVSSSPTTSALRESYAAPDRSLKLRQIWRPLWRKEWLGMRRDPQLLARLGYPLVIVAFGLYRTVGNGSGSAATARGGGMISLFITLAIYVLLLSNFLAPRLVNREGRALQLLALAPIESRDVLVTKWAFGVLPIAGLVEVFVIAGSLLLHFSFWAALLCLGAFGSLAIAMVGAMLALSLIWPRLDWDKSIPASEHASGTVWHGWRPHHVHGHLRPPGGSDWLVLQPSPDGAARWGGHLRNHVWGLLDQPDGGRPFYEEPAGKR
ncbi:MAG TPA: hypothetical protein VNL71_24775, partial [Chloroflexota bacterium]|nr:hypothetical protein [Chloroflexota bacterium]